MTTEHICPLLDEVRAQLVEATAAVAEREQDLREADALIKDRDRQIEVMSRRDDINKRLLSQYRDAAAVTWHGIHGLDYPEREALWDRGRKLGLSYDQWEDQTPEDEAVELGTALPGNLRFNVIDESTTEIVDTEGRLIVTAGDPVEALSLYRRDIKRA